MSDPPDTRDRLLEAGAEMFAMAGLSGTRIQQITARAGINERMIYHHFGSKEGLYRAVLEEQWLGLGRLLAADLDALDGRDVDADLRRGFLLVAKRLLERPTMMRLALHESMGGWTHVPEARLIGMPQRLRALFGAGQSAGRLRPDVSFELVYLAIVGAVAASPLLLGRFVDTRGVTAPPAVLEHVEQFIDLVLRGARPAPEGDV